MRVTLSFIAALALVTAPAFAQMGGHGGGMGGGRGNREAEDTTSGEEHHGGDRHIEMASISLEKFDKTVATMFRKADLNHDGMVTLNELQSVIETRRQALIRSRFQEIDANGDGHIDLAEFVAWQESKGSAAASDCAAYVDQDQIIPEVLGPELGNSPQDQALAAAIEPLSATMIVRANVHYRQGVTLDDLLAYENQRFNAADANKDGFLDSVEIRAMRGRRQPS